MSLSQLTLFAEDSHASPFPQPGSEEARKTTVISGQRCYELSGLSDRIGLLAKTLLESSAWHSMMCFLTWRTKATPANRLLFQLVPSMRRTGETESGLLPTPDSSQRGTRAEDLVVNSSTVERRNSGQKRGIDLQTAIKMLPTPTTQEVEHPEMELTENGRRKTKDKRDSHSMNLADTMRLLPTPRVQEPGWTSDNYGDCLNKRINQTLLPTPRAVVIEESYETTMARRKRSQNPKNNTKTKPDSISQYLEMLPTPGARDWKDTGNMDNNKRMDNLGVTVWHKSKKATGKKTGYKLQPAFVEWMMGYPEGWTELND